MVMLMVSGKSDGKDILRFILVVHGSAFVWISETCLALQCLGFLRLNVGLSYLLWQCTGPQI